MRRLFDNIFKIILIALIVSWVTVVFVDYFRNMDSKDPIFCLKKEVKKYEDGEVYICTGLGYKAFRYERKSLHGTGFGPFFTKEQTPKEGIVEIYRKG